MGEIVAINGLDADAQFFLQHPYRHAHIAKPQPDAPKLSAPDVIEGKNG